MTFVSNGKDTCINKMWGNIFAEFSKTMVHSIIKVKLPLQKLNNILRLFSTQGYILSSIYSLSKNN